MAAGLGLAIIGFIVVLIINVLTDYLDKRKNDKK